MAKKVDFKAEYEKQRAAGVDIADPMNNLISKAGKPAKKKAEPLPELKKEPKPKQAAGLYPGTCREAVKTRTISYDPGTLRPDESGSGRRRNFL